MSKPTLSVFIIDDEPYTFAVKQLIDDIEILAKKYKRKAIIEIMGLDSFTALVELLNITKAHNFAIVDLGLSPTNHPVFEDLGNAFTPGGAIIAKYIISIRPRFRPIIYTSKEEWEYDDISKSVGLHNIPYFPKGVENERRKIIALIEKCLIELIDELK
jgi:hypothetical protein